MELEDLTMICMQMISSAGEGRSLVYEAMDLYLNDEFEKADLQLIEAEKSLGEAHRMQFEDLMAHQSRGENIPFSLLLLHAMDITLVSTSEHDMLRTLINHKLKN